jgi:hypothetical protein
LWGNSIGSADADYAFTSTVDSSGNFYFAGCFVGTSDFNASASTAYLTESTGGSNTDIYIEKLSSSGTFVWVKQVVGNGGGCAYGLGADASGNVYLFGNDSGNTDLDPGTGTAIVTSAGMEDIFILKLDSSGNYVWGKSTGGTSTERPNAIAVDPSGNVYATGYFTGTTDLDPSASAANFVGDPSYLTEYIFKWNTNGIYQWGAALSPTGTSSSGYAVAVDSIGSVYVVGRFSGTSDFDPSAGTSTLTNVGGDDGSIWKLSSSGAFLWAKQVGSTSSDGAAGIVITSDDRSIVTGTYSGAADLDTGPATVTFTPSSTDVYIMKLNSNGISTMIREASSLTLSLSTGNLTATKGRTVTITVVASTAGKVTIYADGRKLPKCIDLNISSTSVTCSWTPNVRKSISLTASFNPTDNAFLASSANLSVGVSSRTGTR